MQNTKTILICDDQPIIHETLSAYFTEEGFAAIHAFNGTEAVDLAFSQKPDLIILDIMMPELSGIEACRKIREKSHVPIMMLTAKGEEIDKVLALELGADDYITKPFSTREVVARVKAILRRVDLERSEPKHVVSGEGFEINLNNYDVIIQGEKIQLTPKEVEILHFLASNPRKVFSREQILSAVWGYDYFGDMRVVDTQVKRIRQRLPENNRAFSLTTVYGVGYKFEAGD